MRELVNKFTELERSISHEKGDFALFALFLREDAVDKWDLVVAAPWIESNRKVALPYIANQIQSKFKPHELSSLSRFVLVEQTNPAVAAINRAIETEHNALEVQGSNFFGLPIKHAYIITSQNPNVNVEVPAA